MTETRARLKSLDLKSVEDVRTAGQTTVAFSDAMSTAERNEDDIDASKAPLMDHLIELRQRLMYSAGGLVIAFFICFAFADNIFNFLIAPLADIWEGETGRRFIFTALHEKFFTEIKIAFFAAFCVTFPLIASQVYMALIEFLKTQ